VKSNILTDEEIIEFIRKFYAKEVRARSIGHELIVSLRYRLPEEYHSATNLQMLCGLSLAGWCIDRNTFSGIDQNFCMMAPSWPHR
jgi:hypothetical protein